MTLLVSAAWACGLLAATPALGQQTAAPAAIAQPDTGGGDIIVTARKRQESILNVPVVETALSAKQLTASQIVDMQDLPQVVPGLQFARGELSIGTNVNIRGIGTSADDQGVDQSVSLNIDGLAPGTGLAFESGLFDLQQVEVLRGPQALFFGKSTPGGVISLRTADPTDAFEVTGAAAYDVESRTNREEAVISGPVTDTLKLRLAGMYSSGDGYFHNLGVAVRDTGALTPTDSRGPRSRDYIIRGTVLWNPTSKLEARLKINVVHDYAVNQESAQLKDCPQGSDFAPAGYQFISPAPGNCQLGRNLYTVWMDPAAFPGIMNRGVPFVSTNQQFATLELNYHPTRDITATSVTAYYNANSDSLANAIETQGAGTPLAAENKFRRRELTEEVRLSSDFATPLNFTVGGFYEDGLIRENLIFLGNTALGLPPLLGGDLNPVSIKTYSIFGQGRWKIVPKVELAAGVRWSDETRTEAPLDLSGAPIPVLNPRVHASNFAPEVTLTYRPTSDLTIFGAFKRAYKSGSFSLSTPVAPNTDNSFGEEKATGGEIGIKARSADHRLSVNLAGYYYYYNGLQVGANVPANNGTINLQTINAGAARTTGIDLDASYLPAAVEGLQLNGAVNFDSARYITLNNVPCWGGQTVALGCDQLPSGGLYHAQDLSGTQMIRAPKWQVHFGFNYDIALANHYKLVLGNDNAFNSRFVVFLAKGRPNADNYQGAFIKSDLSLALKAPDDRWEIALIGKNITDKVTASHCAPSNQAGAAFFGTQITGGTSSGADGIDQAVCFVDPGREVWLRFTWRPFARD